VVEIGVGYDVLVVTTTTQCYIYSISNLNTPIIFDIRAPPHFVLLSRRHFLTLDQISGIQVISYEGRVLSSPKFQGLRPEYLTKEMIAISPDTVAVVDSVDAKSINVLDALSGKPTAKLTHSTAEVVGLCLNQHSLGAQDRQLAFVDRNRDLFICMVNVPNSGTQASTNFPKFKLLSHVESFLFNDETDVLVGLADGRLNVWYQPSVPFIDRDLLPLTTTSIDSQV